VIKFTVNLELLTSSQTVHKYYIYLSCFLRYVLYKAQTDMLRFIQKAKVSAEIYFFRKHFSSGSV